MRSRLAVIGTFYARHERTPDIMRAVLIDQSRPPDEFWVMCENTEDARAVLEWLADRDAWESLMPIRLHIVPTPMDGDRYLVVPYANKINYALDRTDCDYLTYLSNDSIPHRDKYAEMSSALDEHPEWGAVYCGQMRNDTETPTRGVVADAYTVLDHTQVMHRRTDDRWSLDGNIRLGDAEFWRKLHASLGPFHPVPAILDSAWRLEGGITLGYKG